MGARERVLAALTWAAAVRPKVGGFPYLAEALRSAGVLEHRFDVVSTSGTYVLDDGVAVLPGRLIEVTPFTAAPFDEGALVAALRTDQAGESTFEEFCAAVLAAGVLTFVVDLEQRTCTYHGGRGESYVERYPAVELPGSWT